jgi:TPR repeat protein
MSNEDKIKADLLKEAVANLRRLSDKGYADAQYLLGDAYASGALGKPEMRESFRLFSLAAKHGHGEAAYRAALCLEEGWGVSKDVRRAVQFLKTAASRNQPGAMLRLGMALFYGRMGFDDRAKTKQDGIKWLTRSAESANEIFPQGPFELAKIYEVGYKDIVIRDLSYAIQLYVKSAELGFVPAATKLGHAYEYGSLGCPTDAALSIHYYSMAAEGSNGDNADPVAMLALCAWLLVGADGILPKDEQQAFLWAEKAATLGLPKAQYAVGYFLENGIGTDRDVLQSSNWYKKAADGGDERAAERLARAAREGNKKHKKSSKDSDCIIC